MNAAKKSWETRGLSLQERFERRLIFIPFVTCWFVDLTHNRGGYAMMKDEHGNDRAAHIVSYNLNVGKVPEGLELDHTCRNRACVNPRHLEPVTHIENVRRGARMGFRAETCKRGHVGQFVDYPKVNPISRYCIECKRQAKRQYRAEGRIK